MATTFTGVLEGIDTEDTVKISAQGPATLNVTVRHRGTGNNDLRVRLGSYTIVVWGQYDDYDVAPGRSVTRSIPFDWDRTGDVSNGIQDFRVRLSRTVLSKRIPWEVTYWLSPL
jgi:hypothetical protein